MKKFLKTLVWATLALAALALIASIAVLIGAQFYADAGAATISTGNTEIAIQGVFEQPIWTILVAWLLLSAAFFIVAIAVIGAIIVGFLAVLFALVVTVAALVGSAVLVASPLIAVAVVIWLIARNSNRAAPPSPPATPPVAA